jgi:hypothetical protein
VAVQDTAQARLNVHNARNVVDRNSWFLIIMHMTIAQLIFQMHDWVYFALNMNFYVDTYVVYRIVKTPKLLEFTHVYNIWIAGIHM